MTTPPAAKRLAELQARWNADHGKKRKPAAPSAIEAAFDVQLRAEEIGGYEREHRFHETRKWRFDFCWPELMLAVELEGGIWSGGRHTTGTGFTADCEKYNAASTAGWIVLRFTAAQVNDLTALKATRAAIRMKKDGK